MNAKLSESLAGGVIPSHHLLATIFKTPIHKRRLCRTLGCKIQEISKKFSGARGNPIRLVEKIIDEAFQIDCETNQTANALRITEHFFNYYKSKVQVFAGSQNCDWHTEANTILREGTEAVLSLNSLEVDEKDLADLLAADEEVCHLVHKTTVIRERIRLRIMAITGGCLEIANGASNQLAPQSTTKSQQAQLSTKEKVAFSQKGV